jgi:hypothetical protein
MKHSMRYGFGQEPSVLLVCMIDTDPVDPHATCMLMFPPMAEKQTWLFIIADRNSDAA